MHQAFPGAGVDDERENVASRICLFWSDPVIHNHLIVCCHFWRECVWVCPSAARLKVLWSRFGCSVAAHEGKESQLAGLFLVPSLWSLQM